MDFEKRISNLESQQRNISDEVSDLRESFTEAVEFTNKFLSECGKAGIRRVAIGVQSKRVPVSEQFPFGGRYSVFSFPANVRDRNGFPAIWKIVGALGISGSCGNSDQHQITKEGDEKLINGVFEVRAGQWRRVT